MPDQDSRSEPLTPNNPRGHKRASLGQRFGCALAVAISAAVIFVFVNTLFGALHAVRKATCRARLNQLSTALRMYCADYDNRLPPARSWSNNLYPYVKNWSVFRCTEREALPGGFAFNAAASLRKHEDLNPGAATPAIVESSLGVLNASDRLESFITPHQGTGYVIFAEGQVKSCPVAPEASAGIVKARTRTGR